MKSKMKLSVGCLLMAAAFAFVSCSKSESEKIDDAWKLSECGFTLDWNRGDGSDHAKVIKTTCAYAWESAEGDVIEVSDEDKGTIEKTSSKLPNTLTITIREELRPEVDLTADVSYKLSFGYYLTVASYETNSITDEKLEAGMEFKSSGTSLTVSAKDLSKIYPKETTLRYTIEKDGEVDYED